MTAPEKSHAKINPVSMVPDEGALRNAEFEREIQQREIVAAGCTHATRMVGRVEVSP